MLSLKENSNFHTAAVTKGATTTHDVILSAALAEFSQKGFLATTTKDVAAAAGVAEVTLFRHFASKDRLFEETIARYSFVSELEPLLRKIDSLPYCEAVTQLAKQLFDTMVCYKDWIVIIHGEVRRSPEAMTKLYQGFLDQLYTELADFFRNRQERGELRSFDPLLAARALHGLISSHFNIEEVLNRKQYQPADRDETISAFVDLLCHGTVV